MNELGSQMSLCFSTTSRIEELKNTALQFTKFLIDRRFISVANTRVERSKLIEWFSIFHFNHPGFVKKEDVVQALNLVHFLKRKNVNIEGDIIEFKSLIFNTSANRSDENSNFVAPPKLRVYINEASVFKNSTKKANAVQDLRCRICKKTFANNEEMESHEQSDQHLLTEQYRTNMKSFDQEIEGLKLETIEMRLERNDKKICEIKIKNVSLKQGITFSVTEITHILSLDGVTADRFIGKDISPGKEFIYNITVQFIHDGTYEYPLVFTITRKTDAHIYRLLIVPTFRVMREEVRNLGPSSPFVSQNKAKITFEDMPMVCGPPLSCTKKIQYRIGLEQYKIPPSTYRIINKGLKDSLTLSEFEKEELEALRILFCSSDRKKVLHNKEALNVHNYFPRFKLMLFLEEYQQDRNMLNYNKKNITLITKLKNRGLYGVQEPGLSEGRPSILRGDRIFIRTDAIKDRKFEGIVHEIQDIVAYLALHNKFPYIDGQKVSIEFTLNRISLRIMHRAFHGLKEDNLIKYMFPSVKNRRVLDLDKKRFFNRNIESNEKQMLAVNNILQNTAYPAPYIIFGPPGTGKTSTMVECIVQVYHKCKNKICAVAPSNTAANLIACRLLKFLPQSSVYRLFGMSVSPFSVPEELKKCSNYSKEGLEFPHEGILKSKSILVMTPITAGRVYGVTGESYFDYVFIDEAGQAEETLTLIPIVNSLKKSNGETEGSLVLVGDPKQLGPVIHSLVARQLGLNMSLIERLMDQCEIYFKKNGEYDSHVITKLENNYRSHPGLLKLSSDLFYDGDLKAKADKAIVESLCAWDELPNKNIPLIFDAVFGKDEKEENSPSYFNLDEINRICYYLEKLIGQKIKGRTIREEDIVILTPYRKQAEKLRTCLKKRQWSHVRATSVEMFQGQESLIVILSTVRSRKEFIPSDYQFGLGFLINPKRFNVAITRAKALMIIVGDPNVLQCDPSWKELIEYCKNNECYRGSLPEFLDEDLNPVNNLCLDLSVLTMRGDEVPVNEVPAFLRDE